MGMLTDYELMASCLAGGLGATKERLERTLGRLIRPSPQGDQGEEGRNNREYRNPINTTAVMQTLRELSDIWQGVFTRPVRFKQIEGLFITLKDKIVDSFGFNPQILLDYHRLAQNLNDLKLSGAKDNSKQF
ncbi:MAG: hypothetical protein LBF22_10495 [Deltaproteobacteria bacterium]|jgi:hypothetical protein|nr:hypothetical protein [Deltaproteobacteria bacterium]